MTTEAGGHVSEIEEPLEAAALGEALFEAALVGALVEAAVVRALDFGVADGLLVLLELQAAIIVPTSAIVITPAIADRAVRSANGRNLNGVIYILNS